MPKERCPVCGQIDCKGVCDYPKFAEPRPSEESEEKESCPLCGEVDCDGQCNHPYPD